MKYRILTVVIILMSLFSLTVSAANYTLDISPDDSFVCVKNGDDLTEISKTLNLTVNEMNDYIEQNDIIYFGVSESTKSQIQISVSSNDFSKKVSDISMLDDKALNEFAKTFGADNDSIVNNNDRKFICIKNNGEYSDGVYTVTQYITICDNKIFYFTGYNGGADTAAEITATFNTVKLEVPDTNTDTIDLWLIVIIIAIIIFSVVAVIMVIGIIKSKNAKEIEEIEQ